LSPDPLDVDGQLESLKIDVGKHDVRIGTLEFNQRLVFDPDKGLFVRMTKLETEIKGSLRTNRYLLYFTIALLGILTAATGDLLLMHLKP
jgi:hypothetical protein